MQGLILIDSPNPIDHKPLPIEVIASIVNTRGQTHALNNNTALREEFQFNASLLGSYKALPFSKTNGPRLNTVMLKSEDVLDTESACGVRYDWLSDQDERSAAITAWEELTGGHVEVLSIPGNHFEAFSSKNVRSLSLQYLPLLVTNLSQIRETRAQIWKTCRYIERLSEHDI